MAQQSQHSAERYAEQLTKDGVVTVENYLDAETCEYLYDEISTMVDENTIRVAHGDMDYNELANADEPILNKRSGETDDGMLDLFNVDLEFPDVSEVKEDEFVQDIINSAAKKEYSPDNINVYLNRSVTNTRGFHADTFSEKFKSFVYLTDVSDESYGPFSYVEGTHATSQFRDYATEIINRVRGQPGTDAILNGGDDATKFTAPKGTLIVANQAGLHRGIPQEEGRERMLLSTSFTPSE